jgi:hypothetical protein
MSVDEGRLEEWVQSVQPLIMHLEAFQLPRDVKLDFGAASLGRLEEVALDRFAGADNLADEEEQGFVDGAVAYVGETLMRVAGGSWIWDSDSDSPLVRPDTELGLAPVSPRQLMATAVDRRDGERFDAVYATWSAAVEELTASQPSWRPVKEPTPGLDPAARTDDAHLVGWLAERSAGFEAWMSAYAPDGTWDFSPASLDALEEVVRRVTPTGDALQDAANRDFVEGAAWYLGEVLCRGLGGEWFYRDPGSAMGAGEYLDLVGPRHEVLTPSVYLRVALKKPGFLRQRYIRMART